jgi:hypothetical protein
LYGVAPSSHDGCVSLERCPKEGVPTWELPAGSRRGGSPTGPPPRLGALRVALGAIWLADGALQLQPSMFTRSFVSGVLLPAAAGESRFVARPITVVAHLIASQVAVWNGLFGAIQLAIGLGVVAGALTGRTRVLRAALAGSIVWSAMVWWLGEGFGGLLVGASPLSGAPGAVVLYLVAAIMLWPGANGTDSAPLLGGRFARGAWAGMWGVSALCLLDPANESKGAISSVISSAASGEPGPLRHLLVAAARALTGTGLWLDVALALLMAAIGAGVAARVLPRLWLSASLVLAAVIWVFGEAFGQILTGEGTDPNSGPLWALLALCMWAGLGLSGRGSSARNEVRMLATHEVPASAGLGQIGA